MCRQIIFSDVIQNTLPDFPQDLIALCRTADGINYLKGMDIHRYNKALFGLPLQLLLKENVIIGHMIPAGTGIRNYRNVKLFDGSDNDLDLQMEEVLERRRLEQEETESQVEETVTETASDED